MKKTLLLPIAIFSFLICGAQVIEKGKKIIGGSLGFGYQTTNIDTALSGGISNNMSYSFRIAPTVGKATRNNFVFGYYTELGLGYSESVDMQNRGNSNRFFQAGAGVFFEPFMPLGKGFSLSAFSPIGFTYFNGNSGTNKSYGLNASISPTLNYSFNNRFLMQFQLTNLFVTGYKKDDTYITATNGITTKHSISSFYINSMINFNQRIENLSFAFRYIF